MSQFVERAHAQQLLAETVHRITEDFGGHNAWLPSAREEVEAEALWDSLAEGGFVGVNIPEEYGGGGQGVEEMALVLEETAALGCPMTALIVTALITTVLAKHGSDAQKDLWLPKIATGKTHVSFAITEPDAGTNSFKIATRATRDGDGWRIRGTKYYISGVDKAEVMVLIARTGEDEKTGRSILSMFMVPTDVEGLAMDYIPTEVISTEKQFTLYFDDVWIDGDALVGVEGAGLKQAFTGLNPERIVVAAMSNGLARYALDRASSYARERAVWGVPIGTHQGVAHPLAECYANLQVAQLATQRAARIYDAGGDAGEASNIAKLVSADNAVRAMDRAIQTHGGNGVATEFGIADLWFVTRLQQNAPVSREMILNYLAQHGLGLPRSY